MLSKNAILVVDDNQVNRRLLERILSPEYRVVQAAEGGEALAALKQHSGVIAGIVLDLVMPGMDGYAFLEQLSKVEAYRNIPILVATADEGSEVENLCLKLGAWDFVRKPYNPNTVRLRLQNSISRSQMYLLDQVRHMAEHDALTDLYNREHFFEASRQLLDANPGERFAFVRMDINRFRLVNSFFGEEEGNRLLQFMAACVRELGRREPRMTYGRMEADVFCFCRPFQEEAVQELMQGLESRLREYVQRYYVEPSFGICVTDDPALSVDALYARASMAAELCKNGSSRRYAYYDDSLSAAAFHEQWVRNEMERALLERQFVVYFQPKYDLRTELPCGAEALVRWKHPERGLIPPNEFIPVFEHNGFISRVDYYVWEEVCCCLRRWLEAGRDPAPISVNVSRVNMYNPNLVETLRNLTQRYGVPPRLLNLELTESAYMDNLDIMRQTLERLHQEGFLVMMDDFGSGYSSLNTLRDIDVDILKIDMKFLPTGQPDSRSERILVSVIRMAGHLNIPVIMEGVETRSQRDFLRSVGCGYVQGYYYAKPMPVEDYERLIAAGESHRLPERMDPAQAELLLDLWREDAYMDLFFRCVWQPMVVCELLGGQATILRVNAAYLTAFGAEEGTVTECLEEKAAEDDRPAVWAAFDRAVAAHATAECECRCLRRNDEVLWTRLHLQYLQETAQGHLVMATLLDISRERALEEELEHCRRLTAQ